LDVRVVFGEDERRTIVESFSGMGPTQADALRSAYQGFQQGVLHVLLAAFLGWEGEQATREEWQVGSLTKLATIGNAIRKGAGSTDFWQDLHASHWYEQLRKAIESAKLGPGVHWVRLYYGQFQGRAQATEVLLDNETWEPVQRQIDTWGWIKRDEFYSVRLFLVLQDPA
jgi:hypothetical protein